MEFIGIISVPLIIFVIIVSGLVNKVKIYDSFIEGAKEGLATIYKIFPSLLGLMVAVGMLRASGTLALIIKLLSPITSKIGMPPQIIPLALMRPISGSGAMSVLTDIFKNYGTDSFVGKCASVMMGSTETTFYTIAVYYGTVGITKLRHTIKSALAADLTGIIMSVIITRLLLTRLGC